MFPASSVPTSLPKRRVHSAVPQVAPFHHVNVLDQKPRDAKALPAGDIALFDAELRRPPGRNLEHRRHRFA